MKTKINMSDKSKKILIIMAKVISFALILVLLLKCFSFMFEPKDNNEDGGFVNPNASGYLSLPQNTLDVMIIGNSDAYSGFSPMEMWNEYGFTSYISATGHQMIGESLRILQKALETQKPKVIILETDQLYTKSGTLKIMARDVRKQVYNQLSIFDYHDRWKEFDIENAFKRQKLTANFASKGQYVSAAVVPTKNRKYMKKTDKREKINPFFITKLNEIQKLCKNNNIELVLVQVPSQKSWTYGRHNAVADYAKSAGIPFIDMDLKKKKIGFDWRKDSRDGGNHLNADGAKKISLYIGKYLKDNYQLDDKRNMPEYSTWNDDYETYLINLALSKEGIETVNPDGTKPNNKLLQK